MFYCNTCRIKNEWPVSLEQSLGNCECCEAKQVVCWDRPSSSLPLPKRDPSPAQLLELLVDRGYRVLTWREETTDPENPYIYRIKPFVFPGKLPAYQVIGEGHSMAEALADLHGYLLPRGFEVPTTEARATELDAMVKAW